MLDSTTRKRIDDARDILVGKLPDPKSQVEQITVALIYKFMNDMDREFEDLGGEAEFFTGEYEVYKWSNIVSKEKSGFEKLNLYAEALEKLSLNNNLPALFRNIFKNVFLPYRDPETFNLFMKEINGFNYEHSEDLGDAFEYLLSIMSSQGDAGQFRTPRHIIDFIVDVVQPKKNESILDPACGTAGFLISAYKHIIKENEEKGLTPDEKAKLTENIVGYDISPDMVRLSLVNLYLHLFPNPKIYEYDTLTNDTRWNDTFDVILANPPFMTPKGGIRPHDKFSISAKRSEVLFVDYIMEHLNITGRAGVIVPEGIVFQTANAYKNLRKNLVENNYLWAVVSLPAGVFNPYSGVKTSILLMDKEIAKKTDNILFVKIDNDGYDLGAQRKQVTGSDMPKVLDFLNEYKQNIYMGETIKFNEEDYEFAVLSSKCDIKAQDYILVGERYRDKEVYLNAKYPMVELQEVCKFIRGPFGGSLKKEIFVEEGYLVYEQYHAINDDYSFGRYFIDENKFQEMRRFEVETGDILISCSGTMGKVSIIPKKHKKGIINQALLKLTPSNKVLGKYVKIYLQSPIIQNKYFRNQVGAAIQNVASVATLKRMLIPLPPLSIQEQIVEEIELKEKRISELMKEIEQIKNDIQDNVAEVLGE
ncbi:N-6 DNA methylase [Clostridium sp. UBA5712]|uniref:N-6 DNA methylase n=1 Tax=Clostridium sp. UBA5712 TaxID=1946368 RepID=UPI00321799FB